MNDCLFCKIAKGEIPCNKIYETKDFLAFMDIKAVNKGHLLVIPKQHSETLLELPQEQAGEFVEVIKKVASAAKQALNADGFNLGMNNGEAAGQVIFHTHMHIIPRYERDGLEHWHGKSVSGEELDSTCKKIVSFL